MSYGLWGERTVSMLPHLLLRVANTSPFRPTIADTCCPTPLHSVCTQVDYQGTVLDFEKPFRRVTMNDLVKEITGGCTCTSTRV